ncbi:MAG: RsiV family protein, partial [Eubacteriales bacterium]|nr:RsiV family protein [Eubacteriales bacterium]
AINAYYQSVAQDTVVFRSTVEEDELPREEGTPPAYQEIGYQITHNDERYLSVLLTSRQFEGNGESESVSATTFARDGVYAGQIISLSQVIGLEQPNDEAGDEKGTAEQLVYRLVWEIIQTQMANVDGDFLDSVDEKTLEDTFSPETDFYMDEDGNLVFYVQAGILAGEVAGVLTFPFAPAELLSAVNEF